MIPVMMGTLHGENAPKVLRCSINCVKTSREEDESEYCSIRRDLLGSVFNYDEKVQVYRNQLHYGNPGFTRPVLTQDERAIRDLFKSWCWAVFRNHFGWEVRSPCIGSRDVPSNMFSRF